MSSKNSSSFVQRVADWIYHQLFPGTRFEKKLLRCNGYRDDSVVKWKRQTGLSWSIVNKILDRLEVFDGQRIRELIRSAVERRTDIFAPGNFYITSFGPLGKSGSVVFYDFSHATEIARESIELWQIPRLPSESRIIFVDDLIGTGRQSLNYINERLSPLLSPSHRPCLFSICGTPAGINRVRENSIFEVLCAMELDDQEFNHYFPDNHIFNSSEKDKLRTLNERLGQNPFDLGLLVAFHHATPNNTMPIIWKEGFRYQNGGRRFSWFALLPRRF